jgi:hypothetical protein
MTARSLTGAKLATDSWVANDRLGLGPRTAQCPHV